MEKENMFISQMNQSSNNMNELSCWENIADQSGGGVDFFESALSSMVSSPTASNNNGNFGINNNGESVVLRELIGRLGSICNNNSGEISPQPYNINNSNNTSCYSTPLNSPPKLNLSMMMENNHRRRLHHDQIMGNMNLQSNYSANSLQSLAPQFSTDPGFAERAARFSCFANKNLGGFVPQLDSSSSSCPSSMVVSSSIHHQSLKNKEEQASVFPDRKFKTSSEAANHEVADSRENSTVSEQINGLNDAKKRKSNARAKPAKDVPSETSETSAKRIKSEENGNEKDESAIKSNNSDANQKQSKDHNSKTSEPPKDYIHVRARRGQATDAHSLAERVRREKISERMKLLQDLVPGCNKVTGKAVMLDEIINYVQSLQRQVEFLSMKLATVNPRMDFNMESVASKDMFQRSHGSFPHNNNYASDSYPCFQVNQANLHGSSVYNGSDQFFDASHYNEAMPQVSTFMEDDLLSVVQMGFQKNVIAPSFDSGIVATTAQMKVEQ